MTQQYIETNYIFNPAAKTITFPGITNPSLAGFQLITNLTTGTLIYQFNNASLGGTVSGNVLTLTYNTAAMNSTDALQILYNPPTGGFFDRVSWMFQQMLDAIKYPEFVTRLSNSPMVRVMADSNTSISGVTTVTTVTSQTQIGGIDARELIWQQWTNTYLESIRRGIS